MTSRDFLKLVEIQTKVASIIPLGIGSVYAVYRFNSFNLKNFMLMFISLITIDMATTAINNYYDYKRARKTHGYNYEVHNIIVASKLKEGTVIAVIAALLFIAMSLGILLFLNTDVVVLLLGALSFMVAVLYSAGPIPISRTPFGELFSGITMGFIIVFISVYIHIIDKGIIGLMYENGMVNLNFDIIEIVFICLISVPAINGIANIMLANNICDIEDDIENKRYTLPVYIGKENALRIYKILYYLVYFDIFILIILKITPIITMLMFITLVPVSKNIKQFYMKQTKKETFILAVKNFVIVNVVYIIVLCSSMLVKN